MPRGLPPIDSREPWEEEGGTSRVDDSCSLQRVDTMLHECMHVSVVSVVEDDAGSLRALRLTLPAPRRSFRHSFRRSTGALPTRTRRGDYTQPPRR